MQFGKNKKHNVEEAEQVTASSRQESIKSLLAEAAEVSAEQEQASPEPEKTEEQLVADGAVEYAEVMNAYTDHTMSSDEAYEKIWDKPSREMTAYLLSIIGEGCTCG